MEFLFNPIGTIETCFKDKFGVPRQSGLVKSARGMIHLSAGPHIETAIKGLELFSHLWLIFVFHQHGANQWKPSVRPPRLGGAKKIGVLASRSPHRPNPIGLSAVKLEKIVKTNQGQIQIEVSGVDLVDGTPILDIKPYLPYADHLPNARAGWAKEKIKKTPVKFLANAQKSISDYAAQNQTPPGLLKKLIKEILELDPRPAFQQRKLNPAKKVSQKTHYGFRLMNMDVKWKIEGKRFVVTAIEDFKLTPKTPNPK